MLSKEEYLNLVDVLADEDKFDEYVWNFVYPGDNLTPYDVERSRDYIVENLKELIEEHFELVELLKKHDLENLSIKELDTWFDRSLWHVNKVNELTRENNRLSNQLVEVSRDVKSKQEMIDELKKTINENIYKIFKNPPLKFEELKSLSELESLFCIHVGDFVVFDYKWNHFIKIIKIDDDRYIKYQQFGNSDNYITKFEENRFYIFEVKE